MGAHSHKKEPNHGRAVVISLTILALVNLIIWTLGVLHHG
jgi:hypothetical protein